MRRLLPALLLLIGCGDQGFGVHLTIEVDCVGLSANQRAQVAELVFTASGDESYTKVHRMTRPLECRERARYLPAASTRRLAIGVEARSSSEVIAQGSTGTFTLESRGFTSATVQLQGSAAPDMAVIVEDGGSPDDLAVSDGSAPDLAGADLALGDMALLPLCPNVMIVIDHTASMTTTMPTGIPDGGSKTRDEIQRAAVLALAQRHDGRVPLGLGSYWGAAGACNEGVQLLVPVARNSAGSFATALGGLGPVVAGYLGVNAAAALVFSQEASLLAAGTPAYVIMIADSAPTCNGIPAAADAGTTEIAAALARGVPTLVVGIDIDNDASLQSFANAGGLPCTNCGGLSFYPSLNGVQFDSALDRALLRVAGNCR